MINRCIDCYYYVSKENLCILGNPRFIDDNCIDYQDSEFVYQIRAEAIDEYKEEVLSRFCECCDQYACNGAMIGSRQECTTICMLRDVCTDIAKELKEKNK